MKKRRGVRFAADGGDWRAMLAARVIRNSAAKVVHSGVRVFIRVPVQRPRFILPPLSWFVKLPDYREFEPDGIGFFVWNLCEDSNTVENIIDAVAERHRLTFHEARVCVTQYLEQLMRRGALAVAMAAETS